ncbi:dihydroneopterin aldolase [Ectothiorhodospiraceae bacterium BW-2]|nr:dihydroneopterin aldolase [Ectothiorhodospiraceae bacterium BW-2]
MDKIFIRQLQAEAVIGVHEWERQGPQPLLFDIEMGFETLSAAQSDSLAATLDYATVAAQVRQLAAESRCQLVETLAEIVATTLLETLPLQWLKVTLTKPSAVPFAAGVGVEIERSR